MNTKNIFVTGDLHGSFMPVREFYKRQSELLKDKDNILICLGDFGGNFFFDYRDEKFKKKLGKYPFTYFVIRGNHEERPSICMQKNPDKWHTEIYFDETVYVENDYPYIKYALDAPAVYTINYYRTLVLPGAYSVDKYHRLRNGWTWFKNEQLNEMEKECGRQLVKDYRGMFNLVLSHTCPIIYEPTDLFLPFVDQSTVDVSMERYLGEIEYNINYRAWLWGHFHSFRDYPRSDGRFRTMLYNDFINLDEYMIGTVEKL
jgi:3-oxoacid CoA-transferase subunit A